MEQRLRYRLAEPDLVSLLRRQRALTPSHMKRRAHLRLAGAVAALLTCLGGAVLAPGFWLIGLLIVLTACLVVSLPVADDWWQERCLVQAQHANPANSVLGMHELLVDAHGIRDRTPHDAISFAGERIDRLEVSREHLVLHAAGFPVHLISRASVIDGNIDAVINALAQWLTRVARRNSAGLAR